jgi:hypothetical protein
MPNLLSSAVSNANGRCSGEWIGIGSHEIQTADAGENWCSEKKGTHSVAPEPGAFSFLLWEVEWLA